MAEPRITDKRVRRWLNQKMAGLGVRVTGVVLDGVHADYFRAVGRAAIGLDDLARAIVRQDDAEIARLLRLYGYDLPKVESHESH